MRRTLSSSQSSRRSKFVKQQTAARRRWWDDAAIRFAGARVHSAEEVRSYLRRRSVTPSEAACAVAACRARGLVDDRACARLWAEHWVRQGYAWAAIRAKLAAKGLSEAVIEQAAGARGTPDAEAARARTLLAKRLRAAAGVRARMRAARLLASHGFDEDLITQVLEASFYPLTHA